MRVDVPTLRCDRCQTETQDLIAMAAFRRVEYPHMSGTDRWDLCPECWAAFTDFLHGPDIDPEEN